MFIRVVRFTGVDQERVDSLMSDIEGRDGPPEGVPSTGVKFLYDADQGTMVVLQSYDTAEDMETGAKVLNAMDAADTPGTRDSVDACEVKLELSA